jgi:DNA (cytosine-5)-methyltransferase 1
VINCFGLFSGIGGIELGLTRAGINIVGFCEIDPYCQRVLRKWWPDLYIPDDIKTLNGDIIVNRTGILPNMLCGGSPCQDISVAGKGEGLNGKKSSLWYEYARLIEELRPRWILFENVPAISPGFGLNSSV